MNDYQFASWTFDNTIGLPGNSQYAYLYDSTDRFTVPGYQPTAALKAPSPSMGLMGGLRVLGAVTPVGQSITLQFYIRIGSAGTNADWALDTTAAGTSATGQVVVPAGTTQTFSWAPSTPECLLVALAGATAPTRIDAQLQLAPTARIG